MAFAARLGALTEELIEVIVGQPDTRKLRVLKDASLQNLRHHNFLRTNQFDVDNQLNGLEERFRVLSRDGLADALRENLDALPGVSNTFTPEVLHFLLELADQPVRKTRLDDLELLRQPAQDSDPDLNWDDIAREDGWHTERDLWKTVDFRDDSSEDEPIDDRSAVSEGSQGTSISSVEAQYRRQPADLVITPQSEDKLDDIRDSQSWRYATPGATTERPTKTITVSELQALREVLFMLRGLENDMYNSDYRPYPWFELHHASGKSFQLLLGNWGEFGRNVHVLRRFSQKDQYIPLLQVFRSAVEGRLQKLDNRIATIEAGLIDIKEDTVVSLIKVAEDLRPHLQPLCSLSRIIHQLDLESYSYPFRYLELLFDAASVAQLEGESSLYEFLGSIFFDCFRVYLRPIREWMQNGNLLANDRTFFVTEVQSQLPLHQVWQDQFALRKSPDGILHAPKFLQPAVEKIFATGKSVVILKHLSKYEPEDSLQDTTMEPLLDFETLMADGHGFAPFSEVFRSGFELWMQARHHSAAAKLRNVLTNSCGLRSILSELQHAYLMVDGARLDEFARPLFNNLDILNANWHDRFLLTQTFQEAFHGVVEAHRVVVTSTGYSQGDMASMRKSVRNCLPAVSVKYQMTWPVRIVITQESIAYYQAVFTLLLQLRRASHVLQRRRLRSESVSGLSTDQEAYYGLRSKLSWFFNCLKSYLSNIVIGPLVMQLEDDLDHAQDTDSIAQSHSKFAKQMRDAACLGSKLDPIRESMVDLMDLAISLEDARQVEVERQAQKTQELSRLSGPIKASPSHTSSGKYVHITEEEDDSFMEDQERSSLEPTAKSYRDVTAELRSHYDRQIRFIYGGLRGAARASKDVAASKWDLLAEMLEIGTEERSW